MRQTVQMWRLGWAIATVIAFASQSHPQEKDAPKVASLSVPKEIKAKVGEVVWVEAESKGKVSWRIESGDREKLTRIDPSKLKSPNILGLIPRAKGKFYIACVTVEGGEIADAETCLLVDMDGPAPPPIPPPGPDNPPVPPSDPLAAKLKSAYDADPAPKVIKDSAKGLISALYAAMADHVKDNAVITTEDLRRDLETTAKGMLPPGALVAVRKVIAEVVRDCLGGQPQQLTPELRTQAGTCFSKIAAAMDAVK